MVTVHPLIGIGGLCPAGMYCPEETEDPLGCPAGTFSNVTGLKSSAECQFCSYGKYCGERNLTLPSGIIPKLLVRKRNNDYFMNLICVLRSLL